MQLWLPRFLSVAIIAAIGLFGATTSTKAQAQMGKLHVGYSAQAGSLAPIWITKEAGIFKKHDLDVELLVIPGGPTAAAALLSGEVPIAVVGGPAVVSSNLAGSDPVMVAGIVNTFTFQIVTVKGITSYQQLKGKRLGVNRYGASPDVAARFALKRMGIDAKELTILQLGEQSTRLQAMMAGQLEAAVLFTADYHDGAETGHERALGSRRARRGVFRSPVWAAVRRFSANAGQRPSSSCELSWKAFTIIKRTRRRA
jgi:ABC-type nitrate/sulfonate/bicarbonate transport system substrate-binding protein